MNYNLSLSLAYRSLPCLSWGVSKVNRKVGLDSSLSHPRLEIRQDRRPIDLVAAAGVGGGNQVVKVRTTFHIHKRSKVYDSSVDASGVCGVGE